MLKNYLTIAIRNLMRHRLYSVINIAGLAIGMACCILILLFVRYEMSYDRFHENADRIYRVATERRTADGHAAASATSPPPLAPLLRNAFPEVLHAVRFVRGSVVFRHEDNRFQERLWFTESSMFDVFDLPLIAGDPQTALRDPYTVVLTETIANKYFGLENPIGKILTYENPVIQRDYTVTGIMSETHNTHFKFDILASFASLGEDLGTDAIMKNWAANPLLYTYLLLPQGYAPGHLEQKFPPLVQQHIQEALRDRGQELDLFLQPLTAIHLHSRLDHEIEPNNHILYIYLFSALACFILFIACINFMNLSTARSAGRAKEVGIRKVAGAHRRQLIRQFLGESMIMASIALLIAAALVESALPLFSGLIHRPLSLDYANPAVLFAGIGIALTSGLIAGTYPAWFLSAFQPVTALKGARQAGWKPARFRQMLVVIQFAISIALIIGTGAVYAQMKYVKTKDLGFDKAQVFAMPIFQSEELRKKSDRIKAEVLQHPDILSCAASSNAPLRSEMPLPRWPVRPEGAQADLHIAGYAIDEDFIPTLEIALIAGRNFSRQIATDQSAGFLINEAAVSYLGWQDPEEALGKKLAWRNRQTGVILGVVKNFHVQSLYQQIEPLVFRMADGYYLLVRLRPNWQAGALDFLKQTWETHVPVLPFEYAFLDDYFEQQYRADETRGRILGGFTTLAIFIACLGLFGLAAFTAQQRTKEIGIRKVLGASVSGIILMLSRDFIKLVLIANLIAWPVAYWAMDRWLENFAYRIDLSWEVFVLSGGLALMIALLTVSGQAWKAARANPVDALRNE